VTMPVACFMFHRGWCTSGLWSSNNFFQQIFQQFVGSCLLEYANKIAPGGLFPTNPRGPPLKGDPS
jgi:hypothetical protein